MAIDALNPGPNGDYPYLPRNPDGTLDTVRMPIGVQRHRGSDGKVYLIDVEPTVADGRRDTDIVPAPHQD